MVVNFQNLELNRFDKTEIKYKNNQKSKNIYDFKGIIDYGITM